MSSLEQNIFGNVQSSIISVSLSLCEVCGCIVTLKLLTLSILILRRYTVSECIKMEKGNRVGIRHGPKEAWDGKNEVIVFRHSSQLDLTQS